MYKGKPKTVSWRKASAQTSSQPPNGCTGTALRVPDNPSAILEDPPTAQSGNTDSEPVRMVVLPLHDYRTTNRGSLLKTPTWVRSHNLLVSSSFSLKHTLDGKHRRSCTMKQLQTLLRLEAGLRELPTSVIPILGASKWVH